MKVREIIKLTARQDNNTGVIPEGGSTRWGFGKVNAYRAVKEILGLNAVEELVAGQLVTWPNPVTDQLNVLTDAGSPAQVTITDISGRVVFTQVQAGGGLFSIPSEEWSAGMYHVRLQQVGRISAGKVIKL